VDDSQLDPWFAKEAIVYCDESGNSGPNYLDAAQPFYVLAGWVAPQQTLVDASVKTEELRKRVSPQLNELKSTAFLGNERRMDEMASLFGDLGQLGCVPLWLMAEKRYCIAAKIVETFLDPVYNDVVKNGITWDTRTRREIAGIFYSSLPSDLMERFAQAYRNPTPDAFRASLSEVTRAAAALVNPELASALDGSMRHIAEIAEAEAAEGIFGKVDESLNMPCLILYLMMVENL